MLEQTNELLKSEIAKLITEKVELPNVLITVTNVITSIDLGHAEIFVSVLPEGNAGTALNSLKKLSPVFTKAIKIRTRLRHVPRFHWHFDAGEIHASELDKIFKEIEDERESKS